MYISVTQWNMVTRSLHISGRKIEKCKNHSPYFFWEICSNSKKSMCLKNFKFLSFWICQLFCILTIFDNFVAIFCKKTTLKNSRNQQLYMTRSEDFQFWHVEELLFWSLFLISDWLDTHQQVVSNPVYNIFEAQRRSINHMATPTSCF